MSFVKVIFLVIGLSLAAYLIMRKTTVEFVARVEVDTPQGIVSDSRLMAVSYTRPILRWISPVEARGGRWRAFGEALSIEVSPGRYLFALIGNGSHSEAPLNWLGKTFKEPEFRRGHGPQRQSAWLRAIRRSEGSFEVPDSAYSYFVSFEDLEDPSSVFRVDPDALEGVFGAGVRLKSFTLTAGVKGVGPGRLQQLLPWLDPTKGNSLCPPSYTADGPLCGNLTSLDFIRIR